MEIDASLLMQVGLILLSTKLLGEIVLRKRFPPVVGEVAAGVMLGPFLLGWVQPSEAITMLANFGIICLLFLIGLNSEYRKLFRIGPVALAVALGGIVLPLGLSILILPGTTGLIVGAALTATSIGVVISMLKNAGKLSSPEGQIITAASVIDDIVGVIVLAVITGAAGASLMAIGGLTLKTIGFLAITLLAAISFTIFWQKKALQIKRSVSERTLLPLFLGVAFVLAWMAVQFELAAVIGAFIAGVIFSEIHDKKVVVTELRPFFDVFVPIFFFAVGMEVNLFVIPQAGWLAGVILLIAIASKVIGCGIPALLKLPPNKSLVVGLAMVPRMEVALIVMGSALAAGLIADDVYSAFVFSALALLVLVPPMIRLVYSYHPHKHL